ncbi:MAG: mannosyltransferase family protein [Patescibacteria group bacterium]
MQKRDFWFVLKSFIVWRIAITLIATFAIKYIPLSGINFFGGKYINYITNPLFWGWANFDGEHYLSIAMYGYKDLQLAFFPAYPFLMNIVSRLIGSDTTSYLWSGIILSNILLVGSLILFWKIIRLDYSKEIAKIATILLLVFPTSFYFGSVYTESLFLFTSLLTYYLYRKNKYLLSGLVGILMTLTRLYGIFVIVMILFDLLNKKTSIAKIVKEKIYLVGISIFGITAYMWFCYKSIGDLLAFYSLQTNVGEHRSLDLIMLPQVFYRYVAKIIPNLTWSYPPVVFTTLLELGIALLFLIVILSSYTSLRLKKLKWDYWVYILFGYLTPTLTGSFSSLPRYVLVLFPAFIFMATKLEKANTFLRLGIYLSLAIIAIIAQAMFFRGYFVS